ncbi:YchJ family protein [Cedecea sp. FDAARGOS_727]|uniref:YchJ family protein n=1 Tax=Cedecea sp. FDAARGOS_727 TaxID=2545798 RepID=UPI00143ED054|nr:YchJ family protein [Cedecea sp. FDAARGOS_727]QIX97622.1 YchJ family protein [Cedecea sp. FDAARGOS_727]
MLQLCPCGSGLEYSLCCQPYLSAGQHPQRPSQLMRSRYTAFVLQDADYLVSSWHESCRHPTFKSEISGGFGSTEWLGLTVYEEAEGSNENEGYVSFVARFNENGKQSAIIERSRFVRENGRWYYIDGQRPQFGRNDPCPCGSGKKYKKCCG